MSLVPPQGKWDARYVVLTNLFLSPWTEKKNQLFFRFAGPVPHDLNYYSKCMLGGILACGLTHAAITPLDVTKCNMQVHLPYHFSLF